ncbi:response regulator [Arcobacter sp. FWKO B]|uniref:response regulator n=1 Tax=Arcobacter sp. FWKO B TaxID=2593672 RepID=UPI0018A64320|nr:response regulator [Arcobacter sp. FWKO B]QOG11814.1 response regulator [Arcobacter sp. FWKO B]
MGSIRDLNILKWFNILYIEDDVDLLTHTKDVLEDFVHNIYTATNSKEALQILQTHKVDAIISDILLEHENGIEFLTFLKNEKNICIPTILTTAHTDTQYLLDAIKLKVESYIVKPINIKELLNTLHDILLPIIQQKEIKKTNNIIKMISVVTDNKQVDVIKHIINNLDENECFTASYSEIMDIINISKPTLIKLFKELLEKEILVKINYKTYKFNEIALLGVAV